MIITECPHCDAPAMYSVKVSEMGVFSLRECEDCGEHYVIEATRTDGTTYTQEHFETEILPELDDFERCDHPNGSATLYCDPEKLTWT